jgi:xanthine dehydrogenase accessory factor
MTKEDIAVYRAVKTALEEGRPCALATVLSTRGSTPRKTGAKMVVEPGRGLVGTIGGGCGEAEVIEAAKEVLESGRHRIVQVNLTDDPLSWSASICGGVLDVFVEPVYPVKGPGPANASAGGP